MDRQEPRKGVIKNRKKLGGRLYITREGNTLKGDKEWSLSQIDKVVQNMLLEGGPRKKISPLKRAKVSRRFGWGPLIIA